MYRKPLPSSPTEAPAFLADQRGGRDPDVVEEQFGGVVVDHRVDRPDFQAVLLCLAHVDQEGGNAVGAPFHLVRRRGAREQQHQVGMRRSADPDLLAADDVAVAVAGGAGAELRGVRTRRRFGDREGL
jgi:hypothetical protein